jgi:hypothetical protein
LFSQFDKVVALTQMMRQIGEEEQPFRDFLERLRNGNCVVEDWNLLEPRLDGNATNADSFRDCIHLKHSNNDVDSHNLAELYNLSRHRTNPQNTCRINARHFGHRDNSEPEKLESDLFMGLESSLCLARGARVMLTWNLWTKYGLTNGATGTVKYIVFEKNVGPPALPIAVIVEMDEGYTGPCLDEIGITNCFLLKSLQLNKKNI